MLIDDGDLTHISRAVSNYEGVTIQGEGSDMKTAVDPEQIVELVRVYRAIAKRMKQADGMAKNKKLSAEIRLQQDTVFRALENILEPL